MIAGAQLKAAVLWLNRPATAVRLPSPGPTLEELPISSQPASALSSSPASSPSTLLGP